MFFSQNLEFFVTNVYSKRSKISRCHAFYKMPVGKLSGSATVYSSTMGLQSPIRKARAHVIVKMHDIVKFSPDTVDLHIIIKKLRTL